MNNLQFILKFMIDSSHYSRNIDHIAECGLCMVGGMFYPLL